MADETNLKPVKIQIIIETVGLPKAEDLAAKPGDSKPGGKPPEPGKKEAERDRAEDERERKPRPNRPDRPDGPGRGRPAPTTRRGSLLGEAVQTFILAEIIKTTAPIVAGIVEETVTRLLGETAGNLAADTIGAYLKDTARRIAAIEAIVMSLVGAAGDAGSVALAQRALTGKVDSAAITSLGLQRVAIRTAEADIATIRRIAGQELAGKAGAAAAIDAIKNGVVTAQ